MPFDESLAEPTPVTPEGNDAPPRSAAPRRIAVFVGNYVDVVDGVAKTIRRWVQHLRERGDEVVVFAPVGPNPAFEVGPEVHALPTLPLLGFAQDGYRYAYRLDASTRAALDELDPQIVHVASPDRAASCAIDWARERGVPVVGSFHTNFASYFRFLRGWGWLESIAWRFVCGFYGRLDEVYVPTASMLDELREHGLRAPAQIWSRGVDLERFAPAARSLAWRRAHGIADDEVVIAFVARLFWEKGVRKLARVLTALRDRGVRHRVLIAGEGPAHSFLRKQLPDARMIGFVTGEELSRAYASADLFVYPSETDTFGNVTLEALASGLPVVAADAPGTRCVIGESSAGRLIDPRDDAAMLDAVEALVRDEALRRAAAKAASARAAEFSWFQTLERLSVHYDRMIARGARSSAPAPLAPAPLSSGARAGHPGSGLGSVGASSVQSAAAHPR